MSVGTPKSILFVDDDVAFVQGQRRWLSKEGCEVLQARSRADALELRDIRKPDAIVIEAHLGDDAGLLLVDECLRQQPLRPLAVTSRRSPRAEESLWARDRALTLLWKVGLNASHVLRALATPRGFSLRGVTLQAAEEDAIKRALLEQRGNVRKTAQVLQVGERVLRKKILKLLINLEDYRGLALPEHPRV